MLCSLGCVATILITQSVNLLSIHSTRRETVQSIGNTIRVVHRVIIAVGVVGSAKGRLVLPGEEAALEHDMFGGVEDGPCCF